MGYLFAMISQLVASGYCCERAIQNCNHVFHSNIPGNTDSSAFISASQKSTMQDFGDHVVFHELMTSRASRMLALSSYCVTKVATTV